MDAVHASRNHNDGKGRTVVKRIFIDRFQGVRKGDLLQAFQVFESILSDSLHGMPVDGSGNDGFFFPEVVPARNADAIRGGTLSIGDYAVFPFRNTFVVNLEMPIAVVFMAIGVMHGDPYRIRVIPVRLQPVLADLEGEAAVLDLFGGIADGGLPSIRAVLVVIVCIRADFIGRRAGHGGPGEDQIAVTKCGPGRIIVVEARLPDQLRRRRQYRHQVRQLPDRHRDCVIFRRKHDAPLADLAVEVAIQTKVDIARRPAQLRCAVVVVFAIAV